jgi:hypothetical protein
MLNSGAVSVRLSITANAIFKKRRILKEGYAKAIVFARRSPAALVLRVLKLFAGVGQDQLS